MDYTDDDKEEKKVMLVEALRNNSFFCISLTIAAFCVGTAIQNKWKSAVLNPILIGAGIVMVVLCLSGIPVADYQDGCRPLSYFMTPATICLSISFAEQLEKLKKHMAAMIAGVTAGTVCSLASIAGMAYLFGLDSTMTISILPKSVTTAIGVAISEQAGGIAAITAAAIILTGILGNMAGPVMVRLFHIKDEIAQGVAYGTASHVIGTSRAMECSSLAGAAGSFALTVAGLLTAVVLSAV